MRNARRLLFVALVLALTACSDGDEPLPIKELPPMSRNCEWLTQRFEEFAAQQNFCAGLTPHALLVQKPSMGGARLDRVNKTLVKIRNSEEEYFQYDMQFSTRTTAQQVSIVSKQEIDFQTDKFYAVDLYNVCRFQTISSQDAPTPKLLESFVIPNKLSCI